MKFDLFETQIKKEAFSYHCESKWNNESQMTQEV